VPEDVRNMAYAVIASMQNYIKRIKHSTSTIALKQLLSLRMRLGKGLDAESVATLAKAIVAVAARLTCYRFDADKRTVDLVTYIIRESPTPIRADAPRAKLVCKHKLLKLLSQYLPEDKLVIVREFLDNWKWYSGATAPVMSAALLSLLSREGIIPLQSRQIAKMFNVTEVAMRYEKSKLEMDKAVKELINKLKPGGGAA